MDPAGNARQLTSYTPYGHNRFKGLSGSKAIDYGFSGKELHEGPDLSYFETRFLSSGLARFNQTDTLTLNPPEDWRMSPQKWHPYSYCWGNPVTMVDKDGRNSTSPQAQVANAGWWRVIGGGTAIAVYVITAPVSVPATIALVGGGAIYMTAGVAQVAVSSTVKSAQDAQRINSNFNLGVSIAAGSFSYGDAITSHLDVASEVTSSSNPELSQKLALSSAALGVAKAGSSSMDLAEKGGHSLEFLQNLMEHKDAFDGFRDAVAPKCHMPAGCAPSSQETRIMP
jgi:RHS repeat-associated protein